MERDKEMTTIGDVDKLTWKITEVCRARREWTEREREREREREEMKTKRGRGGTDESLRHAPLLRYRRDGVHNVL